jgi:hypothetical protein
LTTENTENTEKNSKDELAKKPRRALLVRAASFLLSSNFRFSAFQRFSFFSLPPLRPPLSARSARLFLKTEL